MKTFISWQILIYLRFFAKLALIFSNPKIIGITGSVGKSSTRNALDAILREISPTKTIFEGNSETGIPLGILGLPIYDYAPLDWLRILALTPFKIFNLVGIRYLVVEMGIDDPLPPKNMAYLLTIVKPHISVFLNVYPVHTEQFEKNLENTGKLLNKEKSTQLLSSIAYEKGKIITDNPQCEVAIYSAGNTYVQQVIHESKKDDGKKTYLSFGEEKNNSLSFVSYSIDLQGCSFIFSKNRKVYEVVIEKYLLPRVYREVFAAALLVSDALHIDLKLACSALSTHFTPPKGRASIFEGINHCIIIDSSYNASRGSVLAFLDMVGELKKKHKGEIVFLFGDMGELGGEAQKEHEEVVKYVTGSVDYLYCVGPLTQKYVVPFVESSTSNHESETKKVLWFDNSKKAGEHLKTHLPKNSIVFVKGSQNGIFLEEAIKYILKNPDDKRKLCRQTDYWMKRKATFF